MPAHPARHAVWVLLSLACAACTGLIDAPLEGTERDVDTALDPSGGIADTAANAPAEGSAIEQGQTGDVSTTTPTTNGETGNNAPPETSTPSGSDKPADPPATPPAPPVAAPAADISFSEIAIYQGVKISLAKGTSDVTDRNAPVVANRPALLRVFVTPSATFKARTLTARLTLVRGAEAPKVLQTDLLVDGPSTDADRTSTFNFELDGASVQTDTEYSVTLFEGGTAANATAAQNAPRFPETGESPVSAESAGSPFRVVVVPVRYNADGSGRTPRTDQAALDALRNSLFSLFPTSSVEVSARAPMDFAGVIAANGNGWGELLDACLSLRNDDGADAKTYYYCMFNPASDFGAYCRGGCVAGLGPVPPARDTFSRAAIGLGFGDAAGTMAHELGHTLGRPHAPCGGVSGADPGYPHAGGKIGSWGYDLVKKELLSPDNHTDLMGYCDNAWISDYNYELVFNRFKSVLTAPRVQSAPQEVLSIVIDADLSLSLGHTMSLSSLPGSEDVSVRYLDEDGALIEDVVGSLSPASHANGGIVYVKAPSVNVRAIEIAGFGTLTL